MGIEKDKARSAEMSSKGRLVARQIIFSLSMEPKNQREARATDFMREPLLAFPAVKLRRLKDGFVLRLVAKSSRSFDKSSLADHRHLDFAGIGQFRFEGFRDVMADRCRLFIRRTVAGHDDA